MEDFGQRVRVRGREGEEVEWSRKAARRAGRLNNWLNDLDPSEDTVFPIHETATTVLRALAAMCDDDTWSTSHLDECSLIELATLIEGASNLIAKQALESAQAAFASRLDGKRATELRMLLGATDDFKSDEEREQTLAEPAFTPDGPMQQHATAEPPALPVHDDAAEAALAKVGVGTLIELKGVNRAWRALGRRALCSRLCRREGRADPRVLDEITELNLQLLIEAGRPWEAVRAGRLLLHLERLSGYGVVLDVAAVRALDFDRDLWRDAAEFEDSGEEEEEGEEDTPLPLLHILAICNLLLTDQGELPLALLLGAIACAGSGEIGGIPVEELRADTLSSLDLSGRMLGPESALLLGNFLPLSEVLKDCNVLQNNLDVDSAAKLAKIGSEKGIMLSGMTRDQTQAYLTAIGPADVILIASDLKFMTVLTTLALDGVKNKIDSEGANVIAEALTLNTVLTELDLRRNNFRAAGAMAIAEALKVNAVAVTDLNLGCNAIGDGGAMAFAGTLEVNKVLTVLNLELNNIGPDGAKAIAEALKNNTVLTRFCFGRNPIGDSGAITFVRALEVNMVLTELNLELNNIGLDGAKAIAEVLKINTKVTDLNLSWNLIGDDGAKALAEALKVNTVLTVLALQDCAIGDEGAKAIAGMLKLNAVLAFLQLKGNPIGAEGAEAIASAPRPTLT